MAVGARERAGGHGGQQHRLDHRPGPPRRPAGGRSRSVAVVSPHRWAPGRPLRRAGRWRLPPDNRRGRQPAGLAVTTWQAVMATALVGTDRRPPAADVLPGLT